MHTHKKGEEGAGDRELRKTRMLPRKK